MGKSTEEFINEILEAELGNHSMLVDIREKIRLGKHLSSYEERYLNVLKLQTKNDYVLELPKKTKPKITYEKIKQKEQPKQPQEEITSAINEQEKLVAEKQKEFESYQTQISSQQDLYQSKQKELVKMRTKLLNIQTQYKVLHMQTDSQRKLLDEIKQYYSTHKLEEEYHELESELESKREEVVELKKQKQSVVQQTEQITQEVAEQEKKLGPKRVYYAPTINCLYYACFMEYSGKTGKTTDERIRKTPTFQKFDIIYDRWIKHPVFSESVSELVVPEQGIAHKEVRDALKEYCKLIIKCQEVYEEVRNDLGMYWRNLIGSAIVAQREPDYYKNTIKQIYKYIIPVKTEIDSFASKTEEVTSEYRNEK